jgi:hypothetical protein
MKPDARSLKGAGASALFAGLRGRGATEQLDTQTAVMIPIVAAMLADGRAEPEELREIQDICACTPVFERNSREENQFLIFRATKIIEDDGLPAALERATATLTPALRETAYVHAVRVVFSDGYVGKLEKDLLEQMTEWLRIDRDRARMMVEVVSIMHHPSTA